MVAGEDDDVEVRCDGGGPVKLLQRIVKVGNEQ
jgi:hypothetical protein